MRSYRPVLVTPPAEAPVTLAEAKAHCRVTSTSDDVLITGLIAAAVSHLDGWSGVLGRCLVTQTWRQDFGGFASELRLPMLAAAVSSVSYVTTAGVQATLSSSVYQLGQDALGSYLVEAPDQSWPDADDRESAVSVTFTSGYGAASAVPAGIKSAIILMVGKLYATARSDQALTAERVDGVGSWQWDASGAVAASIDRTIEALLAPYRIPRTSR
jgi:uncharacterized phiE125 gp8 family phage protein